MPLMFYDTTDSNNNALRDAEVCYAQISYALTGGAMPTIVLVAIMV